MRVQESKERILMMELTQRDKKLIKIMAYILLLMGLVYLVILPILHWKGQLEIQKEELKQTELEMKSVLHEVENIEEDTKILHATLAEVLAKYYPTNTSQGAERKVTALANKHGLVTTDFVISPTPTNSTLSPYLSGASNQAPTPEEQDNGQQTIQEYIITLTATGSRDQVEAFIDESCYTSLGLRIKGFDVSDLESGAQVRIGFSFYMAGETK